MSLVLLILLQLPQNHLLACCVTHLLAEGVSPSIPSLPVSHRLCWKLLSFLMCCLELPGRLLSKLLSARCQPIWRGSILQQESG